MSDDQTTVASDDELDDGTAAQEAAQEEEERQAAAAEGMDPDGPTSETLAETPEDGAVMDGNTGGEGGGGGGASTESESGMTAEEAAAYEEMNFGAGDDDSMSVLTPDEMSASVDGGEDKIEELGQLGGSTSGGEPGLGDLGGYGTSGYSEPTVATEWRRAATSEPSSTLRDIESGVTIKSWNDEQGRTASWERTDPSTGETTQGRTGDSTANNAGEEVQIESTETVTTDESGTPTSSTEESTSADGKYTWTNTTTYDENGNPVKEEYTYEQKNDNGTTSTYTRTTTKDSDGNVIAESETPLTTESSGDPLGGDDPVPGGLADSHVEELQDLAPEDTGPGNVDPNEHDDGEGSGDPTWDVAPDVVNPSDEDEAGGPVGGQPDQSGWDVDPADEDGVAGGVGPDDDSMELPGQQPVLSASDVLGDDDAGTGLTAVEADQEYVVVANSLVEGRPDGSGADDFGSGVSVAGVANTAAHPRPVSAEPDPASDAEAGVYEEALVVQVVGEVAVPAEPDSTSGRGIDTDLDEAELHVIADALGDGPSRGDGEDDLDPFD